MRIRALRNAVKFRSAVLVLALLVPSLASLPSLAAAHDSPPVEDDGAFVQGEKSVETRLLAPCCWNGTLDVHESDLARELRKEIRLRLRGGESVDAVEASMVERYGDKVRAAPANEHVGVLLGAGALAAIGMAILLLRRSVGGMRLAVASTAGSPSPRDEWDERLDDELTRRRERTRA